MNNPIAIAVQGKRWQGMTRRALTLRRRYGFSPAQMERQLARMVQVLADFDCPATFPITAAALLRHSTSLKRIHTERIEFAAHGYSHLDHARMSFEEQRVWFERAQQAFEQCGIECHGFRAPYARWNEDTLEAVRNTGWLYDSSAALAWQIERETDSYRRALQFYGARSASDEPSLPRLVQGVVVIPFALPDDEALVERLGASPQEMAKIWIAMLDETYARGELLVLNLHPERFQLCETALVALLERAHQKPERVWFARLDEIARWWRARVDTQRWRDGARSALCITGDIDALTLGDYAMRLFRR